ncbi:MAG: DUF4956 domain-containing protein [Lachnospiraceae bacterium]|nr:DUF4956 domain-containing protein [Lachnospiraceae bacterium]
MSNLLLNSVSNTGFSIKILCICIVASIIFGFINAVVFLYRYKRSNSFFLTLILVPVTVCVIIMLVNGNIGTGIAVAGAFTLVRFRSIPGTAREITAIFVSMAIGLAAGMGYVGVAGIVLIASSVTVIIFSFLTEKIFVDKERILKITIPENLDYDGLFDEIFSNYLSRYSLESVATTNMGTMFLLTYSVSFKSNKIPKEFIDEIRVKNANLNISINKREELEVL